MEGVLGVETDLDPPLEPPKVSGSENDEHHVPLPVDAAKVLTLNGRLGDQVRNTGFDSAHTHLLSPRISAEES